MALKEKGVKCPPECLGWIQWQCGLHADHADLAREIMMGIEWAETLEWIKTRWPHLPEHSLKEALRIWRKHYPEIAKATDEIKRLAEVSLKPPSSPPISKKA